MVVLDDALQDLAKLDEQQSRIVELRFLAASPVIRRHVGSAGRFSRPPSHAGG